MFEKLQYNPAQIGKYIFPRIQWESKVKKILLTFDDAPNPGTTELILEKLEKNGLKAVFFCVASQAEKHPELIKMIKKSGHTIGNHSLTHPNMTKLSKAAIESEIIPSTKILSEIAQEPVVYFRPPYGEFNYTVLRACRAQKLTVILWSLLTHDYKNDPKLVKFGMQYLNNNSIVVLHDNLQSRLVIFDSIDLIVEKARILNFEFGKPSECLK